MPAKKYIVKLEADEREQLLELTSKGEIGARKTKRAQIPLKANEGWKDKDIGVALIPVVQRLSVFADSLLKVG